MAEFPDESESHKIAARPADELVIDVVDEQTLREARARNVARMRLLWRSRSFLIKAALGGLLFFTVVAFLLPTRYTSTAELMPPDESSGGGTAMIAALSGRLGRGLASIEENALGVKTSGALFIGILNSDAVRDDLIQKFQLQQQYRKRYIEDARTELARHTSISEDTKSGLIRIEVADRDPKRAAAMAQEYVNQLNWVVTHLSTSSAHRERVFLDERLRQVASQLDGAEKQFGEFASQKGVTDISAQGKAMVTAAASLQGQLIAARSELEAYRQIYTDQNVRVRSLRARVDELQSSLQKLAGNGANEKSSAQQLYPSLRELPLVGVTYADLLRRTKVEEAVFETLTKEDELAKVQEAKDTPSVRVLDRPQAPNKKSWPPRVFIMTFGTVLSFVFGAVWILASAAWKGADPKDPRKAMAIEVWTDVHASLPWNSNNGALNGVSRSWFRKRLGRKQEHPSGA